MIWIVFAALTLAVLALLVAPLLRPRKLATDRADYDLAVYRDQLNEVDADIERGLLTAAQADAARTEIKRRMLAAADRPEGQAAGGSYKGIAAAVALVVAGGGLGLYLLLGQPSLPDQPFATRADKDAAKQMADIGKLIDDLAERLKQTPEDAEGWTMLARSARAMERFDLAAEAYRRLIALGKREVDLYAGLGESLLFLEEGFSPAAVAAFQDALRIDAGDVRSRFYLGMAEMEKGDAKAAIAIWNDMVKTAPADAEWVDGVQRRIAEAGQMAGIDPATVAPKAPVLPAAGSTPAAASDTQAMITAMIDGLAAKLKDNPGDAEGWKRLGRAYRVQQKLDLAKDAYGKAMALLPKDVDAKLAYADVVLAQAPQSDKALPAEFVAVLKDVVLIDPVNSDALYYLGLDAAQSGRAAEAKDFWGKLLATLPEGSPERAGLQKQIEGLGG